MHVKRRKNWVMMVLAIMLTFISFFILPQSVKVEANNDIQSVGELHKVAENKAEFNFKDHISFDVDENGIATITDTSTNQSEVLPNVAKDKNNDDVVLIYTEENGALTFTVRPVMKERGVGKCATGVAGGVISGGTAGGLAGASVGTVTLPVVGTVSGGVAGTVGGAVGGGLTGIAASCFD